MEDNKKKLTSLLKNKKTMKKILLLTLIFTLPFISFSQKRSKKNKSNVEVTATKSNYEFMIIKGAEVKMIDESIFLIFLLFTALFVFYLLELFSFRWNQLTDTERIKLTTFLELKKNLSKILEAFNLGVTNFTKPLNFLNFDKNNQKQTQKKWVRNDKNDNIKV